MLGLKPTQKVSRGAAQPICEKTRLTLMNVAVFISKDSSRCDNKVDETQPFPAVIFSPAKFVCGKSWGNFWFRSCVAGRRPFKAHEKWKKLHQSMRNQQTRPFSGTSRDEVWADNAAPSQHRYMKNKYIWTTNRDQCAQNTTKCSKLCILKCSSLAENNHFPTFVQRRYHSNLVADGAGFGPENFCP